MSSVDSVVKMRELELEPEEETKTQGNSEDDGDTCDDNEIMRLFENCLPITDKCVAPNKYILQISGTVENNPNIALNLSNNTCEVYNLSNNQFAQLVVLSEHTDVISEIKFCNENSNLLYTGSNDGSVKLWDLRTGNKSTVNFKDTTVSDNVYKQVGCCDVSPNNILLAAGTNLFEGDAFIMFWDVRNQSLLGAYWESHTDDVTQVKFHPEDSNKLISGSVDGLINLYDLSQPSEEDALIDSLNTESSIEKLKWLQQETIGCVTHTADIQFWKVEDAQPYLHLHRSQIAKEIKRKSEEYVYVVDVHEAINSMYVLAGSNYHDGECFRGLAVNSKTVMPALGFSKNKQRVRASWFNSHINLLLTGGEKGFLNAWKVNASNTTQINSMQKKSSLK